MRFTSAIRGVYGSIAVVLGLALLIALLSTGPSAAFRAALGLAFATTVAGALYVERAPVPWSLSLALAFTTLHALLLLFGEGGRVHRDLVVGSVFVAACWTAYGMARRAERIARAHPELRMARRLRGRTIEDELGVVSTKYRDRARAERRARRRRALVIAGSVVAALATVVFLAVHSARRTEEAEVAPLPPPPFAVDGAVGKFREAWNANRLDLVKEMFVPEWRAQYGRILDRHVERRGWKPLPTLPPPRMALRGGNLRARDREGRPHHVVGLRRADAVVADEPAPTAQRLNGAAATGRSPRGVGPAGRGHT
jgi:hypothetical protein